MTTTRISNIALFVDVRRTAAVNAAKVVADITGRHGIALQVIGRQAGALELDGAHIANDYPKAADILISLGGDGTLLQAAHVAGPLGIPIIGVDFGRVGFLTEVPRDGYEAALSQILRGSIKIERHLALEARVVGQDRTYYAINDVHIDRKHHGHIVSFGIHLSGVHIATIPADGVVVASPTGSTAYFLSAGGPIMSPKLEAFGIAPICPHTLFSRPLIVGADEKVAITLPPESHGTELFVDGRSQTELAPEATVEVVRSPHPIQFVRLGGEEFFVQTLERKLHWGVSIKQAIDDD
jgi:NAD+ kinase